MKSTTEQIRQHFDHEVERFSNLETGQTATMDAPLVLNLIVRSAAASNPHARRVLDIGCGAGNYTLKLLQVLPDLEFVLVDLSRPMLDRAVERVGQATEGGITAIQGDIRTVNLGQARFDIILAAAVLHHLRTDAEWEDVFTRCLRALKPGGSLWISDLIAHENPAVQEVMWQRYGEYLVALKGEAYREWVFDYIDREDTPRSLLYQVDLLRQVGFRSVEILHKTGCFAAFVAFKAGAD